MSATDGSPTKIGWKRRSSAASFSMCLRYSSSVVAPMARSSPRASIGLSMLRRVDRALGRAGADDRVQLVDEEDDLALARLDLVEDGLQPLLELAAVLRAGEQRADVERPDALALQALGDVAGDDALREPLDDRRLPHAGVADQHRVVLRAAREHLDDAADLLVAADHRVELALPRRASVRSRPNFSSAWYVPSGSCDVTRWPPRTFLIHASTSSRGTTSSASSRCSVETYSSSSCARSSSARVEHPRERGARPAAAAARPGPRACCAASPRPRRAGPAVGEERSWSSSASSRCSG